uniref:Sphingomyelin phosphodiesterase 4 n=1 Tax=Arundo donax TaxID=35708 RepID=A0A0A9DHG5_ARUDO
MPPRADASSLAAAVLDAATPPAAAAAATRVLDYLARHAADHPRAFFADAFPSLLYRLFVSCPSSPSFIDLAAADPTLADLLLSLLAPSGALLAAAAAADHLALIRFVFPSERLPDWLRLALASDSSTDLVSPLLSARVGSELHLSVFEYYLFWFAYYPVSSASPAAPASTSNPTLKSRSRIESWVSTLATTTIRKPCQKPESSLYLKLLYAYLREFVPVARTPLRGMGGGGSILHRTGSDGSGAAESFARAEFLLHTLVQFWLVRDDFSPLPVQTSRALSLRLPSRARAELSERPPSPGLGDAVKLLVMFLNCCDSRALVDARMVSEGMLVWNGVCDTQAGFWNPLIQRPLYRFVLRTFLFCPIGAVIKNAAQVFSVWLAYMEPWKVTQQELDGYDKHQAGEAKETQKSKLVYNASWNTHVLSNYLFYSSMLVHFLGFAHKFIHSDVSSVLLMVYKVMEVLSSSPESLDLVHKVDAAYHSRLVASSPVSDDVLKYVPSIREQLKDWEDGLSETDADGSFLHEHWNSDLRLFSYDENGAYNLLQLLLIRAESEILRLSGDTQQALQTLDSIKRQMKRVFQGHIERMHGNASLEELHNQHQGRGEVFTPKHPSSGRSSWADVKYRGDWMKRPISESEVAWLARILIRLSDWLNDVLRLDSADADDSPVTATYIRFDRSELNTVGGPKDAARMALVAVCSLIVLVGQALLKFMRSHMVKINLRVFASKKLLSAAVVLYAVVAVTRNASSISASVVCSASTCKADQAMVITVTPKF